MKKYLAEVTMQTKNQMEYEAESEEELSKLIEKDYAEDFSTFYTGSSIGASMTYRIESEEVIEEDKTVKDESAENNE